MVWVKHVGDYLPARCDLSNLGNTTSELLAGPQEWAHTGIVDDAIKPSKKEN